jgi:hypothetical protein
VKFLPREDCANVHEAAEVEHNIDAAVDFVVTLLRLLEVCAVPVDDVTRNEASQEIVGSEYAADTDGEKLA